MSGPYRENAKVVELAPEKKVGGWVTVSSDFKVVLKEADVSSYTVVEVSAKSVELRSSGSAYSASHIALTREQFEQLIVEYNYHKEKHPPSQESEEFL